MNDSGADLRRRAPGFTLTELLVALAILGLLAAFGLPALLRYGVEGRLDATRSALKQIARLEAQWFADHHRYAGLNELGYPVESSAAAIYLNKDGSVTGHGSGEAIYRVTVRLGNNSAISSGSTAAPTYFLITAQPMNEQLQDTRCGTLSLASTGQIGATGTMGEAGCWQNP